MGTLFVATGMCYRTGVGAGTRKGVGAGQGMERGTEPTGGTVPATGKRTERPAGAPAGARPGAQVGSNRVLFLAGRDRLANFAAKISVIGMIWDEPRTTRKGRWVLKNRKKTRLWLISS